MDKNKNKIDLSKIDLEKEKEKVTDTPGILEYAHTVGGAIIKPIDKGKLKGRAVTAMHQQSNRQLQQIYEQMQTLARQAKELQQRVEVSERIYSAQMSFEPIISHTYYLYEKNDGNDVLSMISPSEWGKSKSKLKFIAKVTLLADHTWDVGNDE